MSAAAAAATPMAAIFIKRAGDDAPAAAGAGDVYAELAIFPGDSVARLAARACAAFPRWGADAGQLRLYLVPRPPGVAAPSSEAERRALAGDALFPAASLQSVGVETGALLLARGPPPAAAAAAVAVDAAHALFPPAPRARAPGRGPADARALSVSEVVGPTFEHEAREALGSIFREVCPWAADVSRLLSRTLDRDGNAREADVMCYVAGDALGPCVGAPIYGVALVAPVVGAAPPLPAAALRADARFSPTDATRLGPHKYFLAEAYSGANEETMLAKVAQLETLCAFLRARWQDQHVDAPAVDDATQLLGAAALIFSAGDAPRRLALERALRLVSRAAVSANLARLRAAGRLLVVVLDKAQSPATVFQRAVASELGSLAAIPERVAEQVDAMRDEVRGEVRAGLGRLEATMQALLERHRLGGGVD